MKISFLLLFIACLVCSINAYLIGRYHEQSKPQTATDYQIQVNENGVTLMDGSRYVGFIKWVGKASALDSLLLNDNR